MRFSVAAAATFAGVAFAYGTPPAVAAAQSTSFVTEYHTVTDCADDVPNCPAHSTYVTSSVVFATSSFLPGGGEAPKPSLSTIVQAVPTSSFVGAECAPTQSVETISTSYTTVVPTVIYKTHSLPCETPAVPETPGTPSIPEVPSPPSNGTIPTQSVPVIAGASTMGVSVMLAAVAGVFAVLA